MRQLPNLLSSLRLLLSIPIVWAIVSEQWVLAFVLAVSALISDALDGILARRWRIESELGRILDPLADKVIAAAAGITLAVKGMLPVWYVWVVVGRDALILVGSLLFRNRLGSVPPSLPIGKVAALSIGIVLLSALAKLSDSAIAVLCGMSAVLLAASLIVYGARLWRVIRLRVPFN